MTELHCLHSLALFIAAVAGLAVAHRAVLRLPIGLPRLLFVLPLLPIFFILPWTIPIYHLRAILSFIFLWTVPSKLLLLCWDAGIDYPSSGFLYFATMVMLPIRVNGKKTHTKQEPKNQFWWQFLAVVVILNIYSYRNGLPIGVIYVLYAFHIYLGLELMLGGLAKLASACFGVESDPQFNNPFMSTSLSEFWGRRWNLVVTTILRSTVYNPALLLLMRAEKQNAYQSKAQGTESTTTKDLGLDDQCAQKALPSEESINATTNHTNATLQSHGSHTEGTDSNGIIHCGENDGPLRSTFPLLEGNFSDTKDLHISQSADLNRCIPVHKDDTFTVSRESFAPYMNVTDIKHLHPSPCPVDEGAENGMQSLVEMLKLRAVAILVRACGHENNSHSSTNSNKDAHLNGQIPELSCRKDDSKIGDMLKPALKARPAARGDTKSDLNLDSLPSDADSDSKSDINRRENGMEAHELKRHYLTSRDGDWKKGGEKPSMRAKAVAILATFVVSGLVHELIFYYINKSRATGEVTAFFVLHGCATAMETLLRKTVFAGVRVPRPISIALTLTFLYVTSAWLFMPPLTRNGADINTIAEYQRLQSALLSLFTTHNKSSF